MEEESENGVSVVLDPSLGIPSCYGVEQLLNVLRERGIPVEFLSSIDSRSLTTTVAVGLSSWAMLKQVAAENALVLPTDSESLLIKWVSWKGKKVILIIGGDDKGVMYAALDVARVIRLSNPFRSIFQAIKENAERPHVTVRGVCMFLHNEDLEKEWYYSEGFWSTYFHMLAEDRFNSFNLIFAHQTYYLAPPYPFLVEVEEYPKVKVTRLSHEQRDKNLKMLQFISKLARERGIDFIMGIWQHRAWPFNEYYCQPSMVEGLTDRNIIEYSRLALTKLLKLCPDIRTIQLRVNPESGIAVSMQLPFYRDAIFRAMKESGRLVTLDLRGWGALPETIEAAEESGLQMRLSVKYWAEFMGPPYQPAEFHPAYCYADFLRYPRKYDVWYQVWSLGSHRLLLWGDPEYVKRFASTCNLGNGVGFEICVPLSQKGFGNEPGTWRIFASPDYEYYKWEFERYWLFYLLFGRLTYNPQTSEDVWMREMERRFGSEAAPYVMKAYEHGSKVISYLVAYNLSNYNMYIWPEKRIGGLIDYYIETKPSDEACFYGIKEYVSSYLDDCPSAKITPSQASGYLETVADSCLRAVTEAKQVAGIKEDREFLATMRDMEILSRLAQYHAKKVLAGEQLAFFFATGDLWALRRSKNYVQQASEVWMHIVDLTDGVYYPRMVFGPADIGHWKDNVAFVRHDITRLEELEHLFEKYRNFDAGFDFGKRPMPLPAGGQLSAWYQPIVYTYSVERRFKGVFEDSIYDPKVGYGWLETKWLRSSRVTPSIPPDAWETLGRYNSTKLVFRLYGNALYDDFVMGAQPAVFQVDVPNGLYDVTLILKDEGSNAANDHGPMSITVQGKKEVDSLLISAGELVEHCCRARVSDAKLRIEFSSEQGKDWIVNGLIITSVKPRIAHIPVRKIISGEKVDIKATITSPEKLDSATLHYRRKETTVYRPLFMTKEEQYFYVAEIPKEDAAKGIVEYYIEARDCKGNRTIFPARGETEPLSLVVMENDYCPKITHEKVSKGIPGEPLMISVQVQTDTDLLFVKLYYRNLNALEKFKILPMKLCDGKYRATISASDVTETWDIMYYIEAADILGNVKFFPDREKETPYIITRTHQSRRNT